MSSNELELRLIGELPPLGELTSELGVVPTSDLRRGDLIAGHTQRIQHTDVWILKLAEWEGDDADEDMIRTVAQRLTQMAPALAGLNRSRLDAQLLVGITQFEEWGGCRLPNALVAAAAAGNLSVVVSVGLFPGIEDDEDDEDDGRSDGPSQ